MSPVGDSRESCPLREDPCQIRTDVSRVAACGLSSRPRDHKVADLGFCTNRAAYRLLSLADASPSYSG